MRTVDSRSGLESLSREDCLERLAAEHVGRLAVLVGDRPAIFPVNYMLDGSDVVFRSDPGTKVDHGPRSPACFEIDSFDRSAMEGWSVVVDGRLEEVTRFDTSRLQRLRELRIDPWAGGAKGHYLRLISDQVSGRVVRLRTR